MSSAAPSFVPSPPRAARLEELFDEVAELTGQRNAIDARIVEIAAEIDRDELWGMTGQLRDLVEQLLKPRRTRRARDERRCR